MMVVTLRCSRRGCNAIVATVRASYVSASHPARVYCKECMQRSEVWEELRARQAHLAIRRAKALIGGAHGGRRVSSERKAARESAEKRWRFALERLTARSA